MPATSRWTYNVVRPSCLNSPQTGWSSDRYRNFFAPRSTSRSDFRTRVQGLQDTPSADVETFFLLRRTGAAQTML